VCGRDGRAGDEEEEGGERCHEPGHCWTPGGEILVLVLFASRIVSLWHWDKRRCVIFIGGGKDVFNEIEFSNCTRDGN
jgi:hypothetical protein